MPPSDDLFLANSGADDSMAARAPEPSADQLRWSDSASADPAFPPDLSPPGALEPPPYMATNVEFIDRMAEPAYVDSLDGFRDASTNADSPPAFAMHSPGDVGWAAFWGGPLASGLLLASNYARLGRPVVAGLSAVGCALLGLTAAAAAVFVIQELIVCAILNIFLIWVMWLIAVALQSAAYSQHLRNGGQKASGCWSFGTGVLSWCLLVAAGFGCDAWNNLSWGDKIAYGPNETLYYTRGATEDDARQLGNYLKENGFFNGARANDVQLTRDNDGFAIGFIVEWQAIADRNVQRQFELFAGELAQNVFPGRPVTVRLCNNFFLTRKSLRPVTAADDRPWRQAFDAGARAFDGKDPAEAAKQFQIAVQESEKLPPNVERNSTSLFNLALAHDNLNSKAEAEAHYRRALAEAEKDPNHRRALIVKCLNGIGWLCLQRQKLDEAEPLFKRAVTLAESKPTTVQWPLVPAQGPALPAIDVVEPRTLAWSLKGLAAIAFAREKLADAESFYRRAIAKFEPAKGQQLPEAADCYHWLAECLYRQARIADAEQALRRAQAIYENAHGREHPILVGCLSPLARLVLIREEYAEAEALLERSLAIQQKVIRANQTDLTEDLNCLAGVYLARGKYDAAESQFQRVLSILEKSFGRDDVRLLPVLLNYLTLLQETKQPDKANEVQKRIEAIGVENFKVPAADPFGNRAT